jgi:hypothetical protein
MARLDQPVCTFLEHFLLLPVWRELEVTKQVTKEIIMKKLLLAFWPFHPLPLWLRTNRHPAPPAKEMWDRAPPRV